MGQVELCEKSCIGHAVLWNSFDITVEIPFPSIADILTGCLNCLVVRADVDECPGDTQVTLKWVKLLECTLEQKLNYFSIKLSSSYCQTNLERHVALGKLTLASAEVEILLLRLDLFLGKIDPESVSTAYREIVRLILT